MGRHSDEETISQAREKVKEKREKLARAEGERDSLLESLKKNYGIKSIAQAEKEIDKLEARKDRLTKKKQKKMDEIEERYEL